MGSHRDEQERPSYGSPDEQLGALASETERVIAALRLFEQVITGATRRLERYSMALDKQVEQAEQDYQPGMPPGHKSPEAELAEINEGLASPPAPIPSLPSAEGKLCQQCGAIMQRTGSCYTCPQCGENDGCG